MVSSCSLLIQMLNLSKVLSTFLRMTALGWGHDRLTCLSSLADEVPVNGFVWYALTHLVAEFIRPPRRDDPVCRDEEQREKKKWLFAQTSDTFTTGGSSAKLNVWHRERGREGKKKT